MLSLIILIPLLAALGLVFLPRSMVFGARLVALGATFATMVLAVVLFLRFETGVPGYQFEQIFSWVEGVGISFHVGVDGINIGLIVMGAIVAFAACCVSWDIQSREKEFYLLLLGMTGGILGAFASLDLFFFYFFHELALVPTFIMIGVWGRGENRNYATFKITLYLSAGALIALIGLIALYLQLPGPVRTFDMVRLADYFESRPMPEATQNFVFPLLMFGFGILVSLWPFHTWAAVGYSSAPTATAMLHAGVLKKFGLYGLIRVALPLMPEGARAWLDLLALLCLGNILYVGLVAMRQRNLNLLLANSSVAHMGFVFLGIASLSLIGVTGAVLLMVAHGFLAALSFGVSGYLYQQAGHLEMERFSGLLRRLPFLGTVLVMAALAGCGLPGFANFAGEVLVLFGAWKTLPWYVVGAAWGALIIGGVYMLRAVRQLLHGPLETGGSDLLDPTPWRRVPFVLLAGVLVLLGFFPGLLTQKIKPSVEPIVARVHSGELVRVARDGGAPPGSAEANGAQAGGGGWREGASPMVAGQQPSLRD